jgi:serine/threonine protein kinase
MSKGLPFIKVYKLEAELGTYPPFLIREALKLSDNRKVIVKVFCKLGQSVHELDKIQTELQFWRLVSHPKIVPIENIYDEEGFIYIVYEYPSGGDLAGLVMDPARTFSEGFAKKITKQILDALIFLHSNGIVHRGLVPSNIVFIAPTDVPGWADTSKLSFFRIDNSREASIFTDIQDLAFSICSIMRKRAGLMSRTYFNPDILHGSSDWNHLSDEMVDFILQLWTAKEFNKCAENFLSHPWLESESGLGGAVHAIPKPFQLSALVAATEGKDEKAKAAAAPIKNTVYIKMREKSSVGTRRWCRKWGVLRDKVLLLYNSPEEDQKDNQTLAQAIYLENKTSIVTSAARHDHTFGIQDMGLQQIVLWIRFDKEEIYHTWKNHIYLVGRPPEIDPRGTVKSITASSPSMNSSTSVAESVSNFAQEFSNTLGRRTDESTVTDPRERAAAILVQAVDDASRDLSRQIEAQSNAYLRKSGLLQILRGGNLDNPISSRSFDHSLSPYPSEIKTRVHPAVKWDKRVQELMTVMATSTPVNSPIREGQMWFVVDASWYKHWIYFVSSSRRVAPPGPIDNLWMINPLTDRPYEQVIEDTDTRQGDFRRVPPQVIRFFNSILLY